MNISLPPELAEFVTQKVASGRYPTASEVIREGLRLLRERDEVQQKKLEELRTAIAIGIQEADQGKVVPFNEETVERIKARGRSRRQQNGPTQRGGTLTRDLSEQPQPACEAQGVPTPTDKLAPAEAERRRLHNLEVRALHAFYRDLAELLKERYRQWVAPRRAATRLRPDADRTLPGVPAPRLPARRVCGLQH